MQKNTVLRVAQLRDLTSPAVEEILAWGLLTTEDYLKNNREEAIGLARDLTKGRIFCLENNEACVRLYFKHFRARTAGICEEDAVKEQLRVLKVFHDYSPKPASGKWGEYTEEAWKGIIGYMTNTGQIDTPVDPASLYTNDLVVEINAFDPDVAIEAARKAAE